LAGKVALVTGGATGLGADQVKGLLAEGAKVVFGDILDAAGAALEAELRLQDCPARYVRLDVTREQDWRQAVDLARQVYGRLNVLVNNAGIVLPRASIEDRTGEEWDRVMAVNAKGVFLGIKHVIPEMRAAGGGSIINISSLAALGQAQIQEPAYAASKGAVTVFTKVAATQHAHENIRCNSIHPGPMDGGMLRKTFAPDPAAIAKRLERVPMGRLGRPDEIVAGVVFLASDEAAFMTGAEMVIDGGAIVQ
jgi:cyclopentanol dehydrogenase